MRGRLSLDRQVDRKCRLLTRRATGLVDAVGVYWCDSVSGDMYFHSSSTERDAGVYHVESRLELT